MDVKGLAQAGIDTFNDRSFREKAKDLMDPNVVIVDAQQVRNYTDQTVMFNSPTGSSTPFLISKARPSNIR